LFALIQFLAAPPGTVYWTTTAEGAVFGPFINRNHFAFYMNLCIGLAVGLALDHMGRQRIRFGRTLSLLEDPKSLWMVLGIGVMLSSLAVSLSRGGFLALAGSCLVAVLVKLSGSRHFLRPGALVVASAVGGGLLL
jgi:hypothetical protein